MGLGPIFSKWKILYAIPNHRQVMNEGVVFIYQSNTAHTYILVMRISWQDFAAAVANIQAPPHRNCMQIENQTTLQPNNATI